MTIDLRSDGVSKPSAAMLQAMLQAQVGDDVFGDDPSVLDLQSFSAELFSKDAALFCPSGVMCNQVALLTLAGPGNRYLCNELTHTYYFETGGPATMNGIDAVLCNHENGLLNTRSLEHILSSDKSIKAVVIENTVNKGGGAFYPMEHLKQISVICKKHGVRTHLDGARIFNALAETGHSPGEVGRLFDTVSFCLSKGLGSPAGSILTGSKDLMDQARKTRNKLGGAMRQAGYLAAAGLFALSHNRMRLSEDHHHARLLADSLHGLPFISHVMPVHTNIIIALTHSESQKEELLSRLEHHGIKAIGFGPRTLRMVTHLNITRQMVNYVIETFNTLKFQIK